MPAAEATTAFMAATKSATALMGLTATATRARLAATTAHMLRLWHTLWLPDLLVLRRSLRLDAGLLLRARNVLTLDVLLLKLALLWRVMLLGTLGALRRHMLRTVYISMLRIAAIYLRRVSVDPARVSIYRSIMIGCRITIKSLVMILRGITAVHVRTVTHLPWRTDSMIGWSVHHWCRRAAMIC